jgi:hypothetical protein
MTNNEGRGRMANCTAPSVRLLFLLLRPVPLSAPRRAAHRVADLFLIPSPRRLLAAAHCPQRHSRASAASAKPAGIIKKVRSANSPRLVLAAALDCGQLKDRKERFVLRRSPTRLDRSSLTIQPRIRPSHRTTVSSTPLSSAHTDVPCVHNPAESDHPELPDCQIVGQTLFLVLAIQLWPKLFSPSIFAIQRSIQEQCVDVSCISV